MEQPSLFVSKPQSNELPRPDRIWLVDGHHLAYRSYFAFEKLSTSRGEPTQAVFGFLRTLLKLLKDDGDCVIVVFDSPAKTFRHDAFEEYKAGRAPTPDDFFPQLEKIKQLVDLMGLRQLELPGYEADDVIGTLAKKGEREGYPVRILTGDRDSFQLVSEAVQVMLPDGQLVSPQAVQEKHGVSVGQWVDYRSLVGDSSDNLPGAKGIGEKTAAKLLQEWGSLEGLYAHLETLTPKIRASLEASRDNIRLSQALSQIQTDLPLELDFRDCHRREPDRLALRETLEKLEFGSILREMNLLAAPAPSQEADWPPPPEAFLGYTFDRAQPMWASWVGLAAYTPGRVYRGQPSLQELKKFPEIRSTLAKDLSVLALKEGVWVPPGDDPLLLAYLYDPSNNDPASTVRRYGAGDWSGDPVERAQASYTLWETLQARIGDNPRIEWLYREIEKPLSAVLARVEARGISLDTDYLGQLSDELGKEISYLEAAIHRLAGHSFNVNSRDQLEVVLYDELKLAASGKKTQTGKRSTAASALEELQGQHEIIDRILLYRELTKLKSTYLDPLPKLIHPKTGRLHTRFNQTGTATGRLSSVDPNLQNIPVRTEIGRRIRKAFRAAPGMKLIAADYSQIELRVLAHMSGDENLMQVFREGKDIHSQTAAWMFGLDLNAVGPQQRRAAKCLAEGTRIATGRGWLPIEQVSVGDCVQTDGQMRKVVGLLDNGTQPTVRIKTHRGFELRGTPHHRIRAIAKDGAVVWRQLQHLQTDDQVVLRRLGAFGVCTDLPPLKPVASTCHKKPAWPQQLDEKMARWLGYVVTRGMVIRARQQRGRYGLVLMKLGRQDLDLQEEVAALWEWLAGSRLQRYEKERSVHLAVASADLAQWVARWCGAKPGQKRIPDFLWQAPAPIQAAFLQALFEGGGSVSLCRGATCIHFASASQLLVRDVQRILLNFGVASTRSAEPRGRHRTSHALLIGEPSDVERFARHIGFCFSRKSALLKQHRGWHDTYAMPHQELRLRRIYPELSLKGGKREKIYGCVRTHAPAAGLGTKQIGLLLNDPAISGHHYARVWRWWQENDLFSDGIESVEAAEPTHLYDLSVEGKPAYLAEGFISHNTINFGVLYGMSAHRLSNELSIPYPEAENFIERYFASYPRVRAWIDKVLADARQNGYVETLFGRRRFVADLDSRIRTVREAAERMAFNMPVQGTATGDLMKLAMVKLQPELDRMNAHLVLQVHDELLVEAAEEKAQEVAQVMREVLQSAWKLEVPLEVGIGIGENWFEAK